MDSVYFLRHIIGNSSQRPLHFKVYQCPQHNNADSDMHLHGLSISLPKRGCRTDQQRSVNDFILDVNWLSLDSHLPASHKSLRTEPCILICYHSVCVRFLLFRMYFYQVRFVLCYNCGRILCLIDKHMGSDRHACILCSRNQIP